MEIDIREIIVLSIMLFFAGYIFYSFVIDDKEPIQKQQ